MKIFVEDVETDYRKTNRKNGIKDLIGCELSKSMISLSSRRHKKVKVSKEKAVINSHSEKKIHQDR